LMSVEVVPPPSNVLLGLAGLGLNGKTADPVRTGHSMGPDGAGLNPPERVPLAAEFRLRLPTWIPVPSDDVVPRRASEARRNQPSGHTWTGSSSAIAAEVQTPVPLDPPFGLGELVTAPPKAYHCAASSGSRE
jgi:hypothetical protein